MVPSKLHVSYNRAVHAFIMYLGALFGPAFMVIGLDSGYRNNLVLGVVLVAYLIYSLNKSYSQRKLLVRSDKLVFVDIPLCLIPIGLIFSLIGFFVDSSI